MSSYETSSRIEEQRRLSNNQRSALEGYFLYAGNLYAETKNVFQSESYQRVMVI